MERAPIDGAHRQRLGLDEDEDSAPAQHSVAEGRQGPFLALSASEGEADDMQLAVMRSRHPSPRSAPHPDRVQLSFFGEMRCRRASAASVLLQQGTRSQPPF